MVVSFVFTLLLIQSCGMLSGTAIHKVNPQDLRTSEAGGDSSRDKSELVTKEKPAIPAEKTYVKMSAEIVSIKEYVRARFPGKKVIFPDELMPSEKKFEYRVGKDDVLRLFVWNHPDLSMDLTVRRDGQISFPLIGNVEAEGLTIPELEKKLREGFERFIRDPQININPKEVNSLRISIVGQVRKPYGVVGGIRPDFFLKGGNTLLEALSDVEFYPDADLAAAYVTRNDLIIPINLKALLKDGDLTQNILLMAEDRIVIPGPIKEITLLGELASPGKYKVNIDTTLADALSIGKGINRETADLYMAYVARKKQVLPVNLKRLLDYGDPGQNILMEDGDIVYVPNINEKKFYVVGEVASPKVVYFRDPVDLIEAIAQAGGFTPVATRTQVVVVRGDVKNPQIYEINALDMLKGKSLERFILQKGDIVYVPRWAIANWNIFVNQILPTIQAVDLIDVIRARH